MRYNDFWRKTPAFFSNSKAWCSEIAMLLIRATKLCRKSIRKEGCLRDDFGQNSDFGNSKRSKNPESKKWFSGSQIDPLICFPGPAKNGNNGIRGIGQDTRECLVHFCDKDCPVTPECLQFEEEKQLEFLTVSKKESWPAMWRHHLATSPFYLSISVV